MVLSKEIYTHHLIFSLPKTCFCCCCFCYCCYSYFTDKEPKGQILLDYSRRYLRNGRLKLEFKSPNSKPHALPNRKKKKKIGLVAQECTNMYKSASTTILQFLCFKFFHFPHSYPSTR